MRLVTTETVKQGTILAKTILNTDGKVLLNEGVALSSRMIKRLIDKGVNFIYIEDERTKDVVIKDTISNDLRTETISTIEDTFKQVRKDIDNNQSLIVETSSKKLVNLVRQLSEQLKDNDQLITIISDVYDYDEYIFTHSLNVTVYAIAIGEKLGLSNRELETLGLGAILHDVGKMKIDEEILKKPTKLTRDEFEEMKKHTTYGFEILKEVNTIPLLVAHCAFQHHERLDGSGYPRKIKDDKIHLYAKIISVADVFDAVTSNRVYRRAMLPHEGLEILYTGSGNLFDSKIVDAFRKTVALYPVGITVELNDGTSGIVIKQNTGVSDRPVIRVLSEKGVDVEPYEIDLTKKLDVVITNCNLQSD